MAKLTNMQICAWIKAGERFKGRADGNGLYLVFRANYETPVWRFRDMLSGKPRMMVIGAYGDLSLSKAREKAKELSARVARGRIRPERRCMALARRTQQNGDAIDIPLPPPAVKWLEELHTFSCNSKWVLPARRMQNRMIPHIQESTLPVALSKVRAELPDVPDFTIHDFRCTARTHCKYPTKTTHSLFSL